jgi:hypothetical protein
MRIPLCPSFAVLLLLAGCAMPPAPMRPGPEAGGDFIDRPLGESRLSYDGPSPFRGLKVSDGRERHAEAIEIDGGVLFYEERTFTPFGEGDLDPAQVAAWLDRNYRIVENGFSFSPEDLDQRSNRHGRLVFALLSKPAAHCFVFRQGATDRQPFEVYAYRIMLSGHVCRPSSIDSRRVQTEAAVLLSRLMFDGGAHNRTTTQPAAAAEPRSPAVATAHAVGLAVAWGGEELWVGRGELDPEGGLAPFVLRRADGGVCRGRSDKPETWLLDCDDGRAADGSFRQTVPGRGGGVGRDRGGKPVRLIFGP